MSNYNVLKNAIQTAVDWDNNNKEISGNDMLAILLSIINSLGANYQYAGVAVLTPTPTTPGTPDQNVFYIAAEPGIYANFSNLEIADNEVAIFKYNGAWAKETTGAAQSGYVNGLGRYIDNPEFLRVVVDNDDNILYGVRVNGDFYFGKGCPEQVKEYVAQSFAIISELLDGKVDKVPGKGLSSNDFTDSEKEIVDSFELSENPEYMSAEIDETGKILSARKTDGTKVENMPVELPAGKIISSDNPEWVAVLTDNDGRIVAGLRKDGTVFVAKFENEAQFIGEPDTTNDFTISVNTHVTLQSDDDNAQTMLDGQSMQIDQATIMLPSNYSKTGKPVPLMICPHGGGGTYQDVKNSTLYKYFCANGIAVCDCTAMPSAFAASNSLGTSHLANPMAMECYNKMYQYIISKYNVEHDVILVGGSMGGMTCIQIAQLNFMPIKAIGVFCPVTDLYNQAFLNPWGVAIKRTAGIIYGFEHVGTAIDDNFIYDENKVRGYNPIVNGMISMDANGNIVPSDGVFDYANNTLNGEAVKEYHRFQIPIKIWHCKDDSTVNYGGSVRFVNAVRNWGGPAILRPLATGGHGPTNMGGVVSNPIGNNVFRGQTLDIRGVVEEIYLWINRFVKH